jgi:PBSX family phage terminase large subunit
MFGATNPSSFNNYVYKQFIEKPILDSVVIYSKTSDNGYLPKEYLNDLKTLQLSNPEYYKRMVEGHWGSLEGIIFNLPYSQRINRSAMPIEYDKIIAGLDFGFKHPTALVVIGIKDNKHYIIDEVYKRLQTSADIIKLVKEKHIQYNISKIYCDWARPEIIQDLKTAGLPVTDAIKTVFDGILYTQGLINTGNLICCNDCTYTLREFDSFIWDKKDKEQPLKINDDAMDALRYAVFSSRIPSFEFTEVMQDRFTLDVFNPFQDALKQKQEIESANYFNF